MDLYKLETSYLNILYVSKYDHMNFETYFKDIYIYDLTGYHYTISPKLFFENPSSVKQSLRKFISMKASNIEGDFALRLAYEGYNNPDCELKRSGFSSKIELYIKPLVIEYFQEAVLRFNSYFFE